MEAAQLVPYLPWIIGGAMALGTSRDGGAEVSVTFGLRHSNGGVEEYTQLGESIGSD